MQKGADIMRKSNKARSDGRLQSKVYIGNGKYKYVYAHSQKELDKKVIELKIQYNKGVDLSKDRDTFLYWAEIFLKKKKHDVSEARYNTYARRIKNLEPLHNMPISKIRKADIQSIIDDYIALGRSYDVVRELKSVAEQILKEAIDNRVIDYNPAQSVTISKKVKDRRKEKRRALTPAEQKWIEDTPHRAQTAAMIMLHAGLRRGELIALRWSDIDLQNGTINVNKSVEYVSNQPVLKAGAKTAAGTRTVYIPRKLIAYLAVEKSKATSLLVCPSADSKLMSKSGWKRLWESYIKELNYKYGDFDTNPSCREFKKPQSRYAPVSIPMVIEPITAHYLRHTFITNMYLAGVDIITAKEQAGHSDIQTTMEIYTHLDRIYKTKQISKLDAFLEGSDKAESTG